MKVTVEVTTRLEILALCSLLTQMPEGEVPDVPPIEIAATPPAEPKKTRGKAKDQAAEPATAAPVADWPIQPATEVTFDVVRTRLVAISTKGKEHNKAVREAVAKANDTGAPKEQSLSDVDPKFYPGLLKWCDEYEAALSV